MTAKTDLLGGSGVYKLKPNRKRVRCVVVLGKKMIKKRSHTQAPAL